MSTVLALRNDVGLMAACDSLSIARSTVYRYQSQSGVNAGDRKPERCPPLALTDQEKQTVLDVLYSDRFADKAPQQVYATLLDEGTYHCSVRTMYRLLKREHGSVKERRRHVQRPAYCKPELLATSANQVWSWDITKLKTTIKWTYFYLYVIIDIFSRYVVGWMVAYSEQSALAKRLIEQSCFKQNIKPGQLIVHADRGSSMKSKAVCELLIDLGVIRSHSRPHVNNDNPFSEAHFKTLKYCPEFPEKFGPIEEARSFCRGFFSWYNKEHRHSRIGLMTPEQVHYGLSQHIYDQRCQVLQLAFENKPKRFKGRIPKPPQIPQAVWINKPIAEQSDDERA